MPVVQYMKSSVPVHPIQAIIFYQDNKYLALSIPKDNLATVSFKGTPRLNSFFVNGLTPILIQFLFLPNKLAPPPSHFFMSENETQEAGNCLSWLLYQSVMDVISVNHGSYISL